MKKRFSQAIEEIIQLSPGSQLNKASFCSLLNKAWDAVNPENIKSGFKATGIAPFNPKAVPCAAFHPSTLTTPGNTTLH